MSTQSAESAKNIIIFEKNKWVFLLILTLLSTAGLVGSDVYIPMLPTIGKIFGRNVPAMQFTLGIYLLGLSIGQLFLGPLTDRFGRKKFVVGGMVLYFIASILCAMPVSYYWMLVMRFLQAIGACSGLIISRAIVGDIFETKAAGKIFATIFPFVGMSPAISPVIGGFLGFYLGWQSSFIFVGLYALITLMLVIFFLPETLTSGKSHSLHFLKIFNSYPKLLINNTFIAYALAPCVAYIAFFAYMAQSPFIFHAHGYGERAIGTFYITLSLTYVAGNLIGKRLLNYFELNQILYYGYSLFNVGGIILFIAGLFNLPLFMMILAISILTLGNGFLIPLGTAGVIGSFSKSTGYASGLLGFLQLGVASFSSCIVNALSHNSVLGLGIYLFIVTFCSLIIFWVCINNSNTARRNYNV